MQRIIYLLSFVSPFLLFASVLMMAIGVKGDPINLALAGYGLLVMLVSAVTFPRAGHPLFEAFANAKTRLEDRETAKAMTPQPDIKAKRHGERAKTLDKETKEIDEETGLDMLRNLVDVNVAALNFEAKPQAYHQGWSRLDLVVGHVDAPTSWIGGVPELPDDIAWPVTDGKAAMFLAQIAITDLPKNIFGGLGPKSGWLLFFLAPGDWGGIQVIHIEQRGAPRDYPNGAVIEKYLPYGMSDFMQAQGLPNDAYRPPKFALTVTPTHANPPSIFQRLKERDEVWDTYRALDISDPEFERFAVGQSPTHFQVQKLALDAFLTNPGALAPSIREVLERVWTFEASVEAATMGSPVNDEFVYDVAEEPVALLRLPSSNLLSWAFGDASVLGVFIAPDDLTARRWDKAWFSIAD
ncbi:DUF1963 domain-containing protein [uncultured Tateyamaria sp.]|uniref:DUF1963 domain-containing protein n=1 Tax=uncultured Tateyamaria sp. TaxID=455651 RepID=UPI002608F9EC|nr:DUF1963 domain-containing protein [uncultured Tateyamaria sp.]